MVPRRVGLVIQLSSAAQPNDAPANTAPLIRFFYSPGSRTLKAFNEAVSADLMPSIQQTQAFKDTKPRHGHMVLVSGEGKPSAEIERFAARLGAYCVCVPEAGDWLTDQIRRRLAENLPLVMVDSALAGTNQYSKAK